MPYVNIKVTNEGVTTEQKAALIKGATDLLADVLGPVNTNQGINDQRELNKKQKYDIQFIKA